MKFFVLLSLSTSLFLFSCDSTDKAVLTSHDNSNALANSVAQHPAKQHTIKFESKYPTVGLKEFTLITDNLERDRGEAEAVIQTKTELPKAMQTKQREDFELYLSQDFTFRADNEFFDRESYIANRVGDPSKVKQADYRNVVVQFIGDLALITYSNIVEDQPGGPGAWKADMTWADVFTKENGKWKYRTIHEIEFRDLTTPK